MPTSVLRRHWVWTRSLLLLASAATGNAAVAAEPASQPTPPPDYWAYTESVKIPFANPTKFNNLMVMRVRVSLNDGPPMTFLVDTGSVGIVVGAAELPGIDPNAEYDQLTYSSSGFMFEGVRTPVKVTFLDAKGPDGKPVSATVPVLAAKSRKMLPGAVNTSTNPAASQPNDDPRPRMFGIGFGRGADPHQEKNPFVNLDAMVAGKMRRGYTITRDGFTLGLTKETVGDGYIYEQLKARVPSTQMAESRPGLKDWQSASAWVTVNGVDGPRGTVLLDTGLRNMMIGGPDKEQIDIDADTPVTVHMMNGQLEYSFKVGDKSTVTTPSKVTWTNRPFVYVNTGLRALSVFDYLYDADGGYLGLRPTKMLPPPATAPAKKK